MPERRKSVRHKVLFGGVAEIDELGKKVDCVVRDISEDGACVEFDPSAKLPDEMNLMIPRRSRSFPVRIVWRQAGRVGLSFRATTSSDDPANDFYEHLSHSDQ